MKKKPCLNGLKFWPGLFSSPHKQFYMQSIKGGFPNVAGTTYSELASTPRLAEQFLVIAWISQFIEHRTNFSFKQRQVNKAIMITSQITEHANIFFSIY